jgi:putative serine protease PepD
VRIGTVIAVAAITALLIGGAGGYAGTKLAERSIATTAPPSPSAAASQPAPTPRATRTPVAPAPGTLNAVQVAAAALPSAVMIRVGSGGGSTIGSGFVLDDTGLIMTNNHVVADAADGARMRVVFSDGAQAGASLIGRSPTYDIAVIRVKTSHQLVPMPIGDSDDTRVGESVLAIGSPLGLPGTVTQGIVSAKNRPVAVGSEGQASNAYINGTQTDAPINPGNSGGPLVDAGGRVIGVNSAILTLNNDERQAGNIGLGFAIPINQAMEIGKMLIADGKATYPVIGADVADADDLGGVRLTSITQNGPADRAGLRKDDVVTKIDDERVTATEQLIVAVRSHRPGDQVTITYRRNGQVREARVTLGSREG